MSAEKQVEQAIHESVMQNRIIHLPHSPELEDELSLLMDDCSANGLDYWGTDDAYTWRVILDLEDPNA